ncbi:MAG: HEPN domain-containing protein, partial [Ignavibacteria bacterium]|nr:HEPN domain-containing protein [Ignavibacteria bacterium]
KSLEAANLLAGKGLYNDAISRLYYFLYHVTKALLLSRDMEPRSHGGMLRLVALHFVKTGILTPKDSHVLTRLMKYREEADYNPSYLFNERDFTELKTESAELFDKIHKYLKKIGYV